MSVNELEEKVRMLTEVRVGGTHAAKNRETKK